MKQPINQNKSVAESIGVAPVSGDDEPETGPKYVTDCHILPDSIAANQANIIQGRASCDEDAPNAFQGNV